MQPSKLASDASSCKQGLEQRSKMVSQHVEIIFEETILLQGNISFSCSLCGDKAYTMLSTNESSKLHICINEPYEILVFPLSKISLKSLSSWLISPAQLYLPVSCLYIGKQENCRSLTRTEVYIHKFIWILSSKLRFQLMQTADAVFSLLT